MNARKAGAAMLVFWKQRLVILAVPKTGTTALEGALAPLASMVLRDPPQLKHATLLRYRRLVAPLLAAAEGPAPEVMAVVRDPVAWLSSWYRYRTRDDLVGHPNSTRGITFDAFVEEFCRGRPAPFAAVGSQARFVLEDDGRVGIDHVFRHEEPRRLMDFLEARLGGRIDLPRLNVSPMLETTLAPATLERLRRKRPEEFAAWEAGGA